MADDDDAQLKTMLTLSIASFEKAAKRAADIADKQMGTIEKRTGTAGKKMEASMAASEKGVNASLSKIGEKINEISGERVDGLKDQFVELSKSVLLPLAAFATITGAVEAFKAEVEREVSADKLAQSLGIGVEALTQLQHAASVSEVPLDTLNTGLKQLANNALKVAEGTKGGAAPAFKTLDLSVTDALGKLKSGNVLFTEVAQKFSTMQNGAEKTGLAMQIFGRSGAALIPVLNQGKAGLAAMAAQSDALGLTITGKSAEAADQLAEKVRLLDDKIQGIVSTVTQESLPAFNALADSLNTLFDGDGIATFESILEGGIRDLTSFLVQLTGAAQQVEDVITGTEIAFTNFGKGDFSHNWQFESWFNRAGKDGADADTKAKSILDGTYKSPPDDSGKPKGSTGDGADNGSTPPIASKSDADAAKKIDATTKALNAQIVALTETNRQQAENNALKEAGITADDKAAPGILKLADNLYDQKTAMEANNTAASALASTTESAFAGMLDGSKSLTGALGDVAKALVQMALQATLLGQGPLAGILGMSPTTNGAPSGILGTVFGSILSGLHFASGGRVSGPGGPKADRVPAFLSNGEYVVNSAATARHGALLAAINSGAALHFANGGPVGAPAFRPVNDNRGAANSNSPSYTIHNSISIAPSGTPAQNQDLANRTQAALEQSIRNIAADEILKAQRPGNAMNTRRHGTP